MADSLGIESHGSKETAYVSNRQFGQPSMTEIVDEVDPDDGLMLPPSRRGELWPNITKPSGQERPKGQGVPAGRRVLVPEPQELD